MLRPVARDCRGSSRRKQVPLSGLSTTRGAPQLQFFAFTCPAMPRPTGPETLSGPYGNSSPVGEESFPLQFSNTKDVIPCLLHRGVASLRLPGGGFLLASRGPTPSPPGWQPPSLTPVTHSTCPLLREAHETIPGASSCPSWERLPSENPRQFSETSF